MTVENDQQLRRRRIELEQDLKKIQSESQIHFSDHEKRERLKVELAVQEYRQKAQAVRETGMALETVRAMRVTNLEALVRALYELENEDINAALKAEIREIRQFEIDRLKGELRGVAQTSRKAGKAPSGENPGGSGSGSQSGHNTGGTMGSSEQPYTSTNPRDIN